MSDAQEQVVLLLQENRRLREITQTQAKTLQAQAKNLQAQAEQTQALRETVQAWKDEIARLNNLPKRPKCRAGGGGRILERRIAQAETNLPTRLVVRKKKKL